MGLDVTHRTSLESRNVKMRQKLQHCNDVNTLTNSNITTHIEVICSNSDVRLEKMFQCLYHHSLVNRRHHICVTTAVPEHNNSSTTASDVTSVASQKYNYNLWNSINHRYQS